MPRARVAPAVAHLPALAFFALLPIAWTYPLVRHLSTRLPGWLGDNTMYLWDFWWMRTALASGSNFFYSPYLLAPVGADLTLHTHSALAAFVGATLLRPLPVLAALNVATLASLALNGCLAYLLAWRITHDRWAAVFGALIFSTSPYVAAHLNGHFDLVMAWTIVLFALVFPKAVQGSTWWGVLSGLVLGLTVYVSYYYVVYEIVLALCLVALDARRWSLSIGVGTPYPRWLTPTVSIVLTLDVAALLLIVITGGFAASVGPIRISMRDAFNPLQIFWVLLAFGLWIRFRPRITARPQDDWRAGRSLVAIAVAVGTFLLVASPLIVRGGRLVLRGEYVTQQYYWRNAPVGIDVLTLVLGAPFHGVWGAGVRDLYARFGIDVVESGAWLGVVPLVFAVYAIRRKWADVAVRGWVVVGAVFSVWALGSHVHVAGYNTAMLTPTVLLRYVPLIGNARMPGRAMVVVYLAIAMLASMGAAHWRTPGRATGAGVFLAGLAFVDFAVLPFAVTPVECPAIYQTLRDRPEGGALAELPLGLGDGFGAITPSDPAMLACQAVHQRPLVGGVIARLPTRVLAAYRSDPLIAWWLRLSGARDVVREGAAPDRKLAAERMKADDIGFVLLNRRTASRDLREHVELVLPLTLIAEDSERALYRFNNEDTKSR